MTAGCRTEGDIEARAHGFPPLRPPDKQQP
jgi:hypothetical protein